MSYLLNVLTLVAIFTVLGVSLNWLLGYGGMFSIAHGAFFGIGAYTFGILTAKSGWPLIPAFLAAAVVAGVLGGLLGATAVRISGEFLIIASFGVQEVASSVFNNWNSLTGGVNGVVLTGQFAFFGLSPATGALVLAGILAVLALAASRWVARSPRGRVGNWIRARKSDEIAYVGSGRSSGSLKLLVHVVCFAGAGLVGAAYADYLRFVAPNDFDLNASVLVLTVVAIGGAANWLGPLLGSLVAVGLPQLLTFTPLPAAEATPIQQIFYGLALVFFMLFRSNGLLNQDYRPTPPVLGQTRSPDADPGGPPMPAVPAAPAQGGWVGSRTQAVRDLGSWMRARGPVVP